MPAGAQALPSSTNLSWDFLPMTIDNTLSIGTVKTLMAYRVSRPTTSRSDRSPDRTTPCRSLIRQIRSSQ
jgi:hypothetical protein